MDVYFTFEHRGYDSLFDLFKLNLASDIPEIGAIIRFSGAEAALLEGKDFPVEMWRVRSKAYDIGDGKIERISLTMELRNMRAERENAKVQQIAAEVRRGLGS